MLVEVVGVAEGVFAHLPEVGCPFLMKAILL